MGAKKDKDKKILDHKVKKFKNKVNIWKAYGISQKKIDKMEEKQERYEAWLEQAELGNDY